MSLPLGQYDDDYDAQTVFGMLHQLLDHIHSEAKLWPLGGIGTLLQSDAVADTYGAWVVMIPAVTETEEYDIHHIAVGDISANGSYQLQIGVGVSKTVVATIPITRDAVQSSLLSHPAMTVLIDPTEDVWARISCSAAGVNSMNVKFSYHNY